MKIWIVEDEKALAQGLKIAFTRSGYETETTASLAGLNTLLVESRPEIVFLDVRLEDGNGLKALPHILKASPEAHVIVMTAFGDSALAVRAIREGSFNYLDKPFPLEAALNMAQRASDTITLSRKVSRLETGRTVQMIGTSPAIKKMENFIAKVSRHRDVNVLIRGESGTGKEVAARMMHGASEGQGEFMAINCAAIPENLLEAELFGYQKGAYTGATQNKTGLIEQASGGTLFLDEIGDMPLALQSKLLRFLDSRTVRPLGASKEISVSLKIICATCVDLEKKIKEGRFRRDLFYRIATLPIEIPPLRERGNDVIELVKHFIILYCSRLGRAPMTISPDVEQVFKSYPWPGNIRELKNLIERLFILKDPGDNVISLKDLPLEMLDALPDENGSPNLPDERNLQDQMDDFEQNILIKALKKTDGNKTQAAQSLGLSRYALLRRLQKHDME